MRFPVFQIYPGYNPRSDLGDITSIKESIRQLGLLTPLLIRAKGEGYEIVSGHRRFKAITELGFTEVEVIVKELSDEDAHNIAYIDNHERNQLTPIEEARHFQRMIDEFGYHTKSQDKGKSLADIYNIAQNAISYKMQLLWLPEEIITQLENSYRNYHLGDKNNGNIITQVINLTETHCRYICQVCNLGEIDKLFNSLYKDFADAGELVEWEKLKKEEITYRQNLQIKLAQDIIDLGFSVKQVEKKVKELREDLKARDEALLKKLEEIQKEMNILAGIYFKSCMKMEEIDNDSIHLIVTSPPYFAGKEYEAGITFNEYEALLRDSLTECFRVLCPGGRLCLNIGDIPNKDGEGFYPIALSLFPIMQKLGFRAIDKIIWKKDDPWHSNPNVIMQNQQGKYRILPSTEYIYIFQKNGKREIKADVVLTSQITKEEWTEWASGLWLIPSVKANDDHPAKFPDEIPNRIIKMFSFVGDQVLDPFLGSGTTIKICRQLGRIGFGYEVNEKYKNIIIGNLSNIGNTRQ